MLASADLVFVTCGMGGGTGHRCGADRLRDGARSRRAHRRHRDQAVPVRGPQAHAAGRRGHRRDAQARRHHDRRAERAAAGGRGQGHPVPGRAQEGRRSAAARDAGHLARSSASPASINVDFADVRTVMQNGGAALMGTGIGRGENRAMEAAQQAISSPAARQRLDRGRDRRADQHHRRRGPHAGRSDRDQRDHPRRRRATTPRSSSAPCTNRRCRARSASR